jgi:ribosome-binding factor A
MLSYKRSTRIAERIQQELSKIVQELKDPNPNLGFVTITDVRVTDDLQTARAFYSVIGTEQEIQESREILKAAVPEMRHQLALRLNLRRTPTLTVEFDETPSKADRIFELLEKIRIEEEEKEKQREKEQEQEKDKEKEKE